MPVALTHQEYLDSVPEDIEVLEIYSGTYNKILHRHSCGHEWKVRPKSIRAGHGCPKCNVNDPEWNKKQYNTARAKIETRFEILSPYTNQNSKVRVRNFRCGHIFESRAANLVNRNVECPVCNLEIKQQRCQENAQRQHEESLRSLPEFLKYERKVRLATRKIVKIYRETINPENLPIGRAGEEGAHQVDHIRSVKECFLNNIPVEECAVLENLQVITWEENLDRRDMSLQGK